MWKFTGSKVSIFQLLFSDTSTLFDKIKVEQLASYITKMPNFSSINHNSIWPLWCDYLQFLSNYATPQFDKGTATGTIVLQETQPGVPVQADSHGVCWHCQVGSSFYMLLCSERFTNKVSR